MRSVRVDDVSVIRRHDTHAVVAFWYASTVRRVGRHNYDACFIASDIRGSCWDQAERSYVSSAKDWIGTGEVSILSSCLCNPDHFYHASMCYIDRTACDPRDVVNPTALLEHTLCGPDWVSRVCFDNHSCHSELLFLECATLIDCILF